MRRLIVPACLVSAGIAIGALGAGYFREVAPAARFEVPVEHDLDVTHEMSVEEAEAVRQDRFASIHTIEETLALPTDFAETEALYVLAGRADADEVQNLIYQAARIRELEDRNAALGILFLRLTDLDPRSAVAIARSPMFRSERGYERAVWVAWGRLDLDAALEAAGQGDSAQRELAAQALYASLRDLDDARVAKIASALGTEPGRNVRAQHLYALFTESPAAAIRYVESLTSADEQREMYGWLAGYVGRAGLPVDFGLLDLIASDMNRQLFRQAVDASLAMSDPETVLRQALAAGNGRQERDYQVLTALQTLAKRDLDKALEWARSLDADGDESMLGAVIAQLGRTDPDRALAEARTLARPKSRDTLFATIAAQSSDPSVINRIIGMIEDPNRRRMAITQVASNLATIAPQDAIAWASTLQDPERQLALQQVGQELVHSDIDAAISLLDRLPADAGSSLAQQIARNLADRRSVESALSFIEQFKGTPDYSRLQLTVLTQLASSNPDNALRMADRIENGRARDMAYATIVGQMATTDPQQAATILSYINGSNARIQAVARIVHGLSMRDPKAAANWVSGLAPGRDRDAGITALVTSGRTLPNNVDDLIGSIGDGEMRGQAAVARIFRVAATDPDQARRLMDRFVLTEEQRDQIQRMLDHNGGVEIYD